MASWLNKLIPKKKLQHKTILGVNITPQGAAWCVLQCEDGRPVLTEQATLTGEFKTPAAALTALFKHQAPPNVPCHISLSHHFYQMLLVDTPDVPEQELREAVKWRVKDLITQPVESMVLDVFRLPADAYRGRVNMVYVALIERALVAPMVKLCDERELPIGSIGIAELAVARISRQLADLQDRGLAMLFLTGNDGTINLVENGYLYLTRTLEMQSMGGYSGNLDFNQDPTDNLALDIQRSLDYYESQVGKSGVNRVYLLSDSIEQHQWCDDLSQRLPIKAQGFSLADVVTLQAELSTFEQGLLAPAVGIALGGQPVAA